MRCQEPLVSDPGRGDMTTSITVIKPPPWGGTTLVEKARLPTGHGEGKGPGLCRTAVGGPLVDSSIRMANIKSQIKRNKQNETRRERNKAVKTALKTSTKKVQTAIADGDAETAATLQRDAARELDKAAGKGVLHKKTAARKKSRLARQVNATSAA
jgi:small subunit ribosomal protein S20